MLEACDDRYVVTFGNGSSVTFQNRTGAEAMVRFLQRRRMEATVQIPAARARTANPHVAAGTAAD